MLRGLGFGRICWFCVGGAVEEVTRQDLMLMSEGAAYKPPFINPPPPLALLSLNRRMLSLLALVSQTSPPASVESGSPIIVDEVKLWSICPCWSKGDEVCC